MSGQLILSRGETEDASAEGEQPDGGAPNAKVVSERAAMELLGPLERVLMESLLNLGWKIEVESRTNGSSEYTCPRLSFISPTNEVFDAWEDVTQFFGETGKQEGWFPHGADVGSSGRENDVAPEPTSKSGADQSLHPESAVSEDGAVAAGGDEQTGREARSLKGVSQLPEISADGLAPGPAQAQLTEEPDLLSSLVTVGKDQTEELALAAEIMKELEQRRDGSLLAAPVQSPLPIAAAKRSPLPPPIAPATLAGLPLFPRFQPAADSGSLWPAAVRGGTSGELQLPANVSALEGNSKGGFAYTRKDGVKFYHKEACKCRGCNHKRKSGELPNGAIATQEAFFTPASPAGIPFLQQNVRSAALPWEVSNDMPGGVEGSPVFDESPAAVAASLQSLELQGAGAPPQEVDRLGSFSETVASQFVGEDAYPAAEESPGGSGAEVSLQGGLGAVAYQEDDTAFWQSQRTNEEGEEEDAGEGSDVEDLDVFLPRIMEQTGFTPLLTGEDAFMGFGPEAYAAMQAAAPPAPEEGSAIVPYEPPRPIFDHLTAAQQEALFTESGATRKRNVYLCKRCGQIKKGHTCKPAAALTSSRRSLSNTAAPDEPPVAPLPPRDPPPKPVEAPKPQQSSPSLQPYSFASLASPPPPLLDDLQSFFSSPKEEPPRATGEAARAPVPSASERATLALYVGYRPSKAASAAAIAAAGAQRCPRVVLPKYKDPPTNARLLLATGLLEGQHVAYVMQSGKLLLTGWIKGGSVVCECAKCKGEAMVSLSEFEKHAGSVARHPSDYIFLDDGRNLRQLVEDAQALAQGRMVPSTEAAPPAAAENAPGGAPGLGAVAEGACSACGEEGNVLRCSACSREYHAECVGLERPPSASAQWTCPRCQGGGGHGIYRGPPIARLLKQSPATIRRRTPSNVFSLLFTEDGLPDGEAVSYRIRGESVLAGKKARGGIVCGCCSAVVSPSTFEQHAGKGARRNPYTSIFVDSADVHLKDYAQRVEAQGGPTRGEAEAEECAECGDGGNLILCDGCPKGYHPECVRLSSVPKGDWYCGSCDKPRIAAAKAKAALHPAGGDSAGEASEILARCQRLLTEVDTTTGGCILCRMQDFSKSFGDRTIILCDQCEREFHVGCLREHGVADLSSLPEGDWFCGGECARISRALQGLVERGPQALPQYVMAGGKPVGDGRERTWQLLRGRQGSKDNGKVLAAAVDILSKCFDPIIDGASGEDLLPMMVHSRQTADHDFSGMYCLALRCAGKLASCAVVRVFGNKLAEMPLIATSLDARRQGHCRALMTATEWLLMTLGVDRLSLPAAEGAEDTWQTGFGFTKMSHADLQKWRAELQALLVFPGASMLEKAIPALPGVARIQPSPPSLHPRQLSSRTSEGGDGQIMGRPIEEALAAAAEARSSGLSQGKRSKPGRSGQGAPSSAQDEVPAPAGSTHSAEEDAPIMVQFGRNKNPHPDSSDDDDSVPIASMHLPASESQSPGKRKRGRPPGSGKVKVKGNRGRPRKQPAEGDSRPEEKTRESDGESADLGEDGLEAAAKKSKTDEGGEWRRVDGVDGDAKASPIQLQRKALQHTRPRSILGRGQVKGAANTEEGTESKADTTAGALSEQDKVQMFLQNVQKFKDKKRKRQAALLMARLAKTGSADAEMGAERKMSVSETSSRSTGGLKGPRSKRRPRVFVPGGEFWLLGREEDSGEELEKARNGKKLRVVVGGNKRADGAAEGAALEGGEMGGSDAGGRKAEGPGKKKQKKAEREKDAGGQETVAPGEGSGAAGPAEGTQHKIRVLSKSLEPHTGNGVLEGEKKESPQEEEHRESTLGVNGLTDPGLKAGRKAGRGEKRSRSNIGEISVMTSSGEDGGKTETANVEETSYVELEGGEAVEVNRALTGGEDLGGGRPRKKARKSGKRKRAPRGTEAVGPEAVETQAAGGDAPVREEEKGKRAVSGQDGSQGEETGVVKKQVGIGRNGMREGAAHTQDAKREGVMRGGSNAQNGKDGLREDGIGAGQGDEAKGRSKGEPTAGIDFEKPTGEAAKERPSGQTYRRKKGRKGEERRQGAAPDAGMPSAEVGRAVEQQAPSRGFVLGDLGRGVKRDQARQRPSGLIIKGVKGFRKKHPAASATADVSVALLAIPAPAENNVAVVGGKGLKKKADRAAEKRAAGVIVKGVKGFQKKKAVPGREQGDEGEGVADRECMVMEDGRSDTAGKDEDTGGPVGVPDGSTPVHEVAGEERDIGEGVQRGEPAEVRAVEGLRKIGGKGKKKKKKGKLLGGAREMNGADDKVPIRLDLGAVDGDLVLDGAGANEAVIVKLDHVGGGKGEIGGQEGEDRTREVEDRPAEVGAAKMPGRRTKVSRELQALQAVPGASGAAEKGKAANAFVGSVSSTRQRLR